MSFPPQSRDASGQHRATAGSSLALLDLRVLRGSGGLLFLRLSWLHSVEAQGGVVELLWLLWERRGIRGRVLLLGAVWLGGLLPGIPGDGTHDRIFVFRALRSPSGWLPTDLHYAQDEEAQTQTEQGYGSSSRKGGGNHSSLPGRFPWQ